MTSVERFARTAHDSVLRDSRQIASKEEDTMPKKVRILVIGLGNMGLSHAEAYRQIDGFEIVGIMSRSIKSKQLPPGYEIYPRYEDLDEALEQTRPDAVSINSWPNTHASYAIKAIEAGCHVFMEKPIATTIEDAERVVAAAKT